MIIFSSSGLYQIQVYLYNEEEDKLINEKSQEAPENGFINDISFYLFYSNLIYALLYIK